MTKLRGPITYDAALARIAGVIGWPAMATATARAERTVRNWGYARRLEIARAERFADERQLSIFTGTVATEAGEAVAALIAAALPGASDRDRTTAAQQVEELLNAATSTLPLLMGPGLVGKSGGDAS